MRIDDLLHSTQADNDFTLIGEQCSQFIAESHGLPLLKNLPSHYNDFHKVKVRKRKQVKNDPQKFTNVFNEAFEDEVYDLRQRSIFANGEESFDQVSLRENEDPFYIFPIDGYRFMYSKEVKNSGHDYKKVLEVLIEEFGVERGNDVITDLLKFAYTNENLYEGIEQGSEIILYNIPYFYAVRASSITNYKSLLSSIKGIS